MFYDKYLRLCVAKNSTPTREALEMGLTSATVNRWKNGSEPTDVTLLKVAEHFGVSVSELCEPDATPETKKDPAEISEVDQELYDLLTEMKDRPDLRMLFHNAKDASPEQIRSVANMLAKFKQG